MLRAATGGILAIVSQRPGRMPFPQFCSRALRVVNAAHCPDPWHLVSHTHAGVIPTRFRVQGLALGIYNVAFSDAVALESPAPRLT